MESSLINSKGYEMSVQTSMRALTDLEIDEVSGSGYFAGAAAGAGALAAAAGAAACITGPAAPALAFIGLTMGLASAALGYLDAKFGS
jgi:hypothetical protein